MVMRKSSNVIQISNVLCLDPVVIACKDTVILYSSPLSESRCHAAMYEPGVK